MSNEQYRWWMNPDGNIVNLGGKNHPRWAREYLAKDKIETQDPSDTLMELGWIRLILIGEQTGEDKSKLILAFEYSEFRKPSNKLLKLIKDFAIELGVSSIYDDTIGRGITLDENVIKESVNSKLPVEFGEGNLKARKFWMEPNGTFYGFPYEWSHPLWASKYFKHRYNTMFNYAVGELYKKGWIRLQLGWDEGNVYTLWYEHRDVPLTSRVKNQIKNLAIELRADKMKDRDGNAEFIQERTISKSILKQLIKEIINESKLRKPTSQEERQILNVIKSNFLISMKKLLEYPMYQGIDFTKTFKDAVKRGEIKINKNGIMMYLLNVGNEVDDIPSGVYDANTINNPNSKNEVNQKDITHTHPNNPVFFDKNRKDGIGGWDVSKLTLNNLAALKRKIGNSIKYLQAHPNEQNAEWLKLELEQYKKVELEIKNRLAYINKSPLEELNNQVSNQSQCTGTSHGSSNDYSDVKLTRDPLNDPLLNGKLHENSDYRFDEFPETKRGDGFGMAVDVYYGTIMIGTLVSQENGYIVAMVKGPSGDRSYRQDPKKPFKTQEDAARALHRAWRSLRHSGTESV